jgi:hypothetical protein
MVRKMVARTHPADVASGEQQDAARAHVGGAERVLVWPIAQIRVEDFSLAKIFAMRLTCASGSPVTRSTSAGGHFSASLRTSPFHRRAAG